MSYSIRNCLLNKKFKLSKGNQKRDYCYIDDVIDAIFLALKSKKNNGEIINIGSGKPRTVRYLVDYVCKLIGKGRPCFGKLSYRKQENMNVYPNIKKAWEKLKWKPKTSFARAVKLTINYCGKNLKVYER